MTIREFKDTDFASIVELWEKTELGNPKRRDSLPCINRTIELGGAFYVLENDDGKIIGTSWLTNDGRRIYLHHFGIEPSYQGLGLSKALLNTSLQFARKCGLQIKLEVHKDNLKALRLYEKFGFNYLGDYQVYIIRNYD
jgi:ribosomal protein S18 acetylase RimI-like enzyme